jgi:hypothetical protein
MEIFKLKKSIQDRIGHDFEDYRITEVIGNAIEKLIVEEEIDPYVLATALEAVPPVLVSHYYDFDTLYDFLQYCEKGAARAVEICVEERKAAGLDT